MGSRRHPIAYWLLVVLVFPAPARAERNITFPHREDFNAASSLSDLVWVSGGAVIHWEAGAAKAVPSEQGNTYCALGDFIFPRVRRLHVGYHIQFGPDYVRNARRMKHILAHRDSPMDGDDRGMVYVWTLRNAADSNVNLTFGACRNTECIYPGGGNRPAAGDHFWIGDYLEEWVWVEAAFDAVAHTVRVYLSTPDRRFQRSLIAAQSLNPLADTAWDDSWRRFSFGGAYMDQGSVASPGMWWKVDNLRVDSLPLTEPAWTAEARRLGSATGAGRIRGFFTYFNVLGRWLGRGL
jgi:hypothetical protein